MPGTLRREGEVWRYTWGGAVAHYLAAYSQWPLPVRALCGMEVFASENWYGSGTQKEEDRLRSIRECRGCLKALGRTT